jgi:hypothetical protein
MFNKHLEIINYYFSLKIIFKNLKTNVKLEKKNMK